MIKRGKERIKSRNTAIRVTMAHSVMPSVHIINVNNLRKLDIRNTN